MLNHAANPTEELERLRAEVARLHGVEAALQETESRLRSNQALTKAILDSMQVGIVQVSLDERVTFANAAVRNELQWGEGGTIDFPMRALEGHSITPDGEPLPYEDFTAILCLRTGQPQPPRTIGFRVAPDRCYWGVVTAVPVIEPQTGKMDSVMVTFLDVTEARAFAEALKQSDERYRTLVENAPDGIAVHRDGKLVYVNDAMLRLYGASSDHELLGQPVLDFVHPRFREAARKRIAQARQGIPSTLMEQIHVGVDGRLVHVEVSGMACVYNGHESVQVIMRDVTRRKRIERQARRRREILRKFFDHIPVLVGLFDKEGTLKLANKEWTRVLGYPVGTRAPDLLNACYPDPEILAQVFKYLDAPPTGWNETQVRARDGRTLEVTWATIAMSGDWRIFIAKDITQEKATQQALLRYKDELEERVTARTEELTSKNAELQREIAERHDIEARLRQKQGFLEQLLESLERDRQLVVYEIHDTFLQDVIGALMYVDTYVELHPESPDLESLDFARESLRRAITEARRTISGLRPPIIDEQGLIPAIDFLVNEAGGRGLHMEFEHDDAIPRLPSASEAAIFRIVQEAIKNIERHSKARSGEVTIRRHDQSIRLEIRDYGVGFDLNQIGEAHFGLRGIQERAKLAEGNASIQSAPGEGTLIVVDIPIHQQTG